MILTFLLFYLLNIIIVKVDASFQSNPIASVQGLAGINGTTIMISSDQKIIGAGFMDGTFKLYDMQLNQICSNISTTKSSIIGSVWMPSFGPVTVDSSNKLTIWSTQCKIQNQVSFSTPIKGIGFYQSIDNSTGQATGNPTGLIALNFGNFIQQFDVENFNLLTQYVSNNENYTFLDFLYYNDGTRNMLIASTQSSKISIMSMQTGVQTQSFDIQSRIKMMTVFEKTGEQEQKIILGYAENNYIYRFTSGGQPYQLKPFPPSDSIIFCPSNKQFALAFRQSKQIGVYLYSGDNQKILNTLQGIPTGIDCSQSYLVAIDDKGYISVYFYQQFKNWIIAVIIGIAVGLILIIAAVAVFTFFRRKRAKQTYKENNHSKYPKKYPKPKNKQQSKTDDGYLLENVTPVKLKNFIKNQQHL